jgi:hypothetical protein
MDPMRSLRPKHWRSYGKVALALLVLAAAMAAGAWFASRSGQDPSGAYRLSALAVAGAFLCGAIWAGSTGMDDTPDRR